MMNLSFRLMTLVLLAVYAVTSIGPRGATLCLGGGHDWSEVIAASCGHGGHCHDEVPLHDDHSECGGCEHHQSETHGPCTDIPLDGDEARPSANQVDVKVIASAQPTLCVMLPLPDPFATVVARPPAPFIADLRANQQVRATLRAVVLLI